LSGAWQKEGYGNETEAREKEAKDNTKSRLLSVLGAGTWTQKGSQPM
jgi:hypothetical protein